MIVTYANQELPPPLPIDLVFHSDAAHGWLQVPKGLFNYYGSKISSYSYQDKDNYYLEEDLDACRFQDEVMSKGAQLLIKYKHYNGDCFIRLLPRVTSFISWE